MGIPCGAVQVQVLCQYVQIPPCPFELWAYSVRLPSEKANEYIEQSGVRDQLTTVIEEHQQEVTDHKHRGNKMTGRPGLSGIKPSKAPAKPLRFHVVALPLELEVGALLC